MKPRKKVTDPQSIKAKEIPKSKAANPAGVIWEEGKILEDDEVIAEDNSKTWSEKGTGGGGDRRIFKSREEIS